MMTYCQVDTCHANKIYSQFVVLTVIAYYQLKHDEVLNFKIGIFGSKYRIFLGKRSHIVTLLYGHQLKPCHFFYWLIIEIVAVLGIKVLCDVILYCQVSGYLCLKDHKFKVQAVQGFVNCFTLEVEDTAVLQNVRNVLPSNSTPEDLNPL